MEHDQRKIIIYDKMNRPVITGVYDNSSNNFSKASLQNAIYAAQTLAPIVTYVSSDFAGTYPSSITNCELYSFNYYDDLSLVPSTASLRTFDNSFSGDYLTGNDMITPTVNSFTYGKLVASKTKILDPNNIGTHFLNKWTTTVFFYDEQGRVIQSQTQNPWDTTHWDIATNQYDFVGHTVLNISTHHSWASSNKPFTKLITWNVYSANTGEIMETRQQIDQQPWETLVKPQIDALGSLQSQYLGGNIEQQDFSYNIRGQLTGINKSFISVSTLPSNRTFAERLSYEAGFTDRRYDGGISGFEWKTSSSAQSAYGYKYDNLGRMTAADYRDYSTYNGVTSWNKNNRDFSVAGLTYDENGNIKTMKQYGYDTLLHPALIDDFEYGYDAGNRLQNVSDLSPNKSPEDDFDNQRGATTKYSYDVAGNLSEDTLKNLTISYDYFGRPQLIKNIHTGASVENLYDANGSLVQKNVDDGNSNISVYTYWGPYVYKDDTLQYISHAAGRARWLADSSFFKYDYFVQDHLGNVRTVVTSDVTTLSNTYLATHEIASANIESAMFENLAHVREVKPAGSPSDVECEMLTSDNEDTRVGAAIVLRVMAGDKINAGAYSYHDVKESDDSYTSPEAMLSSIINVLAGGAGGFEGGEGENGTEITNNLFSPDNYNAFEELKNSTTYPDYPRAYLNYVVFDDEFNLVREESGAIQVSGNNNSWEYMSLPSELTMSRNGYIALYLSNEESLPVFFDNLIITQHQGRLLEEQHYYPHGLLVNKSVAAATKPVNKYQFQGNEMQDDLGMQLYDFHARQYDPQIGRFTAVDPLADYDQESWTPYHFCGNDPANLVDPLGLRPHNPWDCWKPRSHISTWLADIGDAIQSLFDGIREGGGGGNSGSGNSGGSAGSGSSGTSGGGSFGGGGGVGFGGGGGGGGLEGGGSGPSGGGGGGAGGGSSTYTGSTFSYINGHPYGKLPTMEISGPIHMHKISEWGAVRTARAVEFQDFNMSNGDSYELGWDPNGPLLAMAGDGDGDKGNMTADQVLTRAGTGLGLAGYGWDLTGTVVKSRPVVNYLASMTYSTAAETRSSLSLLSPAYKTTSNLLFWTSIGISGLQGWNNLNHRNYLGATKNGIDLGMSFWGLMGASATFWGGAVYFGIDTYYPSFHNQPPGWPSALEMNSYLIRQNRQVVPKFNLFRDYP